jgi:hypothetical protein
MLIWINRKALNLRGFLLEHDPEKWEPVFGKDHAQTRSQSAIAIQSKAIALWCQRLLAGSRQGAIGRLQRAAFPIASASRNQRSRVASFDVPIMP